jgi:large subunit ribosomal protein L25
VSPAQMLLNATRRAAIGKGVSRLRATGKVPAVIFGHGLDSISIALDAHEFDHIRHSLHSNSMVRLKLEKDPERTVLVHGIQIDPRSRRLLHVDLFAIKAGEEVNVELELIPTGESPAVTKLGGTLLHPLTRIKVRAMPDKLPQSIEFSVSSLVDFEMAIHLRDLPIPEGVTLLSEPDEIVARVAAPHVVETATAEGTTEAAPEA